MSGFIDLHLHSTYSDGLDRPSEILEMARKLKLAAFSISDHDNFAGYLELKDKLSADDPELISGVELSAGKSGEDIHILGYYFDPHNKEFADAVASFRKTRNRRGELMLEKLSKLGIEITMDTLREIAGESAGQ